MAIAILLVIGGLIFLIVGGELLVRGASKLATLAGVSPLVVGLTVVAFGTSAPELAVAVNASLDGQTDIAVGNVVGSNIFNVLFILGISALISPLVVSSQLVRVEVPLMILASIAVLLLGLDGAIGRVDGLVLFFTLVAYLAWTVLQFRKRPLSAQSGHPSADDAPAVRVAGASIGLQLLWIAVGLALLALGARWLVDGAVRLARLAGMSELMIGLTIVAGGTSLPEVVASVMASLRNERDIAVGNVVGSNLFNLMCVLGLAAVVVPGGVEVSESALRSDLPIMIAVAVACLPVFFTGHKIARWEGGLFLGYYVAYLAYLLLETTTPQWSQGFVSAMVGFVLPLTALTLAVTVYRALGKKKEAAS